MAEFAVVGTTVPRIEGPDKATGRTQYAADIHLPGLLWGKILRSTETHSRLMNVDAARARALPGVRAVLTGADLGGLRTGNVLQDMPLLCHDRVRFVGDAIAAVAADTPDIAQEALGLIEVEYEPLPAVFDPASALTDNAPLLHPDLSSYTGRPDLPDVPNLQARSLFQRGDVQQGFAEADLVFEHTFTTSSVHQGYLETRACVVRIAEDGSVSVWSSCKVPYRMRDLLAQLLGLAREQVVVERCSIGGDFGGKGAIGPEPIAYFLARAAGGPVKIVQTSTDEFQAGNPRHRATITLKTGVMRDGRLVARHARILMDGGAYAAHKATPTLAMPSVARCLGPYRIPHTRIESLWAYTNNLPGGNARAPAQPQVVFAGESQMDLVAAALSLDPLEFRLRNIIEEGEPWPDGARFEGVMARPTLELLRHTAGWDTPPRSNRGRGLAISERAIGAGACGLVVTFHEDGRITALSAIPDVGTGAFTILSQVLAEELHVPVHAVRVVSGSTNETLLDAGIGGSKTTFSLTVAAVSATWELRAKLAQVAADRLECAVDDLEVNANGYAVKGYPDSRIPTLAVIAEAAARAGGLLEARSPGPLHQRAPQSCSIACAVEVEVDPDSGQIRPAKIVAVLDAGRAINPQLLQAQVEGAIIQGLGMALMERLASDDGRISTLHLGDYKIPCLADVPELVCVLLEGAPGPEPYEAKSVGELGVIPISAAVANAVASATGARVFDLPISAERVRQAMAARETR